VTFLFGLASGNYSYFISAAFTFFRAKVQNRTMKKL